MEAVMTGGEAFREAMEVAIPPRTEAFAPDVVVISGHFDGHNRDSLGNLNLVEADSATRSLTEIAQRRYGGLHACSPSSRPCADQLIRRQPAVSLVHRFGGRGFEETRHLLRAQHDRRPARFVHGRQRTNEVGAFERHVEEKPQRGDGGVDRPWADLLLRQMQLISAKVAARAVSGDRPRKAVKVLTKLARNPFRLCRGQGVRRDHTRRPRNSFRIRPTGRDRRSRVGRRPATARSANSERASAETAFRALSYGALRQFLIL